MTLLRFRLRIALIMAVALVMAQMGAMSHAYSHGVEAGTGFNRQSAPASTHEFCKDCLNFAPLLAAAGTPCAPPAAMSQGHRPALRTARSSPVERQPHLSFRSRAPPVA